jgi:hypothetical protein
MNGQDKKSSRKALAVQKANEEVSEILCTSYSVCTEVLCHKKSYVIVWGRMSASAHLQDCSLHCVSIFNASLAKEFHTLVHGRRRVSHTSSRQALLNAAIIEARALHSAVSREKKVCQRGVY